MQTPPALGTLDKKSIYELANGNQFYASQASVVYRWWMRHYEELPENIKNVTQTPVEILFMREMLDKRPDYSLRVMYRQEILRGKTEWVSSSLRS